MANEVKKRPEGIDTAYVAHLARMYVSAEEVAEFQPQLEQVVRYVEKLQELDVSGIEPTSHAQLLSNVFRENGVRVGLTWGVGSGATVGRQQQNVAEALAYDRSPRRRVTEIETRLTALRQS